jgi:hypothetical protein
VGSVGVMFLHPEIKCGFHCADFQETHFVLFVDITFTEFFSKVLKGMENVDKRFFYAVTARLLTKVTHVKRHYVENFSAEFQESQ